MKIFLKLLISFFLLLSNSAISLEKGTWSFVKTDDILLYWEFSN